jgi:hypothetical protein
MTFKNNPPRAKVEFHPEPVKQTEALQAAMRLPASQFEIILVDELTKQKNWSGEEIERMADRIRRVAWARQRGEV